MLKNYASFFPQFLSTKIVLKMPLQPIVATRVYSSFSKQEINPLNFQTVK